MILMSFSWHAKNLKLVTSRDAGLWDLQYAVRILKISFTFHHRTRNGVRSKGSRHSDVVKHIAIDVGCGEWYGTLYPYAKWINATKDQAVKTVENCLRNFEISRTSK